MKRLFFGALVAAAAALLMQLALTEEPPRVAAAKAAVRKRAITCPYTLPQDGQSNIQEEDPGEVTDSRFRETRSRFTHNDDSSILVSEPDHQSIPIDENGFDEDGWQRRWQRPHEDARASKSYRIRRR